MVLILKIYLENSFGDEPLDVRRIAANTDLVTHFQLLKVKVQSLFQLSTGFTICWIDAEKDMITISTDEELAQAVANAEEGMLRLHVFITGSKKSTNMQKNHESNKKEEHSPTADQESEVLKREHPGVTCDRCGQNIFGVRYKCLICRDYDLCSACNARSIHHEHDMLKLVKPMHMCREWAFLGGRRLWRQIFGRVPAGFFPVHQADEGTEASSSQGSPTEDFQKAFHNFMSGDFVPAQKLFTEGFGNFLKGFQGVDIKLDGCPFQGPSASKKQKTDKETSPTKEASAADAIPMETAATNTSTGEAVSSDGIPAEIAVDASVLDQPKPADNTPKGLFQSQASQQISDLNTAVKSLVLEAAPLVAEALIDLGQSTTSVLADTSCMDDWTLLQRDDIGSNEASACGTAVSESIYPSLEKTASSQNSTPQNAMDVEQPSKEPEGICASQDPKIVHAILTMLNMGFTNEGGWLERLLVSHNGNINEVLDALYPFAQRR